MYLTIPFWCHASFSILQSLPHGRWHSINFFDALCRKKYLVWCKYTFQLSAGFLVPHFPEGYSAKKIVNLEPTHYIFWLVLPCGPSIARHNTLQFIFLLTFLSHSSHIEQFLKGSDFTVSLTHLNVIIAVAKSRFSSPILTIIIEVKSIWASCN